LKEGTVLRSAEFGLLASIGCVENVKVYTNIVNIGVLSTGNELVSAGIERLPSGKIRDSNKVMLKTIIRETCNLLNLTEHVNVIDLGIIKDDGLAIDQAIKNAINTLKCNILVTSGGVSMGEMDLIKPYIKMNGVVHFGRLNMKPGKPTTFGNIGNTMVFGLPGNPVSSFVAANLFLPFAI
jgi:molybdenum cofactor synthesis domain-containing protein